MPFQRTSAARLLLPCLGCLLVLHLHLLIHLHPIVIFVSIADRLPVAHWFHPTTNAAVSASSATTPRPDRVTAGRGAKMNGKPFIQFINFEELTETDGCTILKFLTSQKTL
jgi:hypothetical protein